ncbi:efflux RND transporter periplasmic adaptor subunit [Bythopirellula polymerisocia]|uniref:HlyD family secretion protein n=1 Tax=Bythopirellula polymerisocia TaxID=2528003 RepID=A0A5C6CSJ3_9BACT|nr:efflux RND transporter periplasmic adaptor subunit [Bythopirellula polymerisocia]TWU27482.1 HlyD family secretion protein [Bythopirellula polymerisocia]
MSKITNRKQNHLKSYSLGLLLIGVALIAFISRDQWWPDSEQSENHSEHPTTTPDHDDHDHAGHNKATSIELSENGLKNIGFEPITVEPTRYEKLLTLPAIIVERPGRSQINVTAPLTGVITKIYAVNGEAITADQPLFEMRLTHEELVAAQRDYLRTTENLAVVNREIERLESLDAGVIAGRRVLDQEYDKQKLEASLRAESQAMLLHGLNQEQVDQIRNTGRLLQAITVRAPEHVHSEGNCDDDHPFQIQRLSVTQGEHVDVGRELATIADHCELHIEGLAFEDDAPLIRKAAEEGRKVKASLLADESPGTEVNGLEVMYVADQIDPDTRAFKFYLRLPNRIALDKTTPAGKQFVEWMYKPGQRMQIKVPIDSWEDQLVLPTTAVVDEGAEAYVYRQNGDHFDQVSVEVLNRDQDSVVVANNGALFRGDIIAGKGAYQMHLALKNKAGGGIDPHAGHNH